MIQHHRRAPSLSPFASFKKKKNCTRVPLVMESPCCPREHVTRSLKMRREQSLRLLCPVCGMFLCRNAGHVNRYSLLPNHPATEAAPAKKAKAALSITCLLAAALFNA